MSKTYSAGIVTAYGAAKRAGYTGTYEDFCRQQAGYAESAASVEQAKTTAVNAASTATAKAGEATTAATAAQTAKTQTEAAASQALTDISTARSGAISAIQTEGATQTTNATAQAQAAATSATTASTKASEASASATNAGQSATNAAASATSAANAASAAQAVLESIPENYLDLSEDVDKLKADLDNNVTELKSTIVNLADTGELNYFYAASISGTKLKQIPLDIPAGTYRLRIANIQSSDTDAETCKVLFYNASNVIVLDKTYNRGVAIDDTVTIATPATYGYVYASNSANNAVGDTFEFTNFRICTIRLETALEPIPILRKRSFTAQDFNNINAYLNVYGTPVSNALYKTTQPFPVNAGDVIHYHLYHASDALPIIVLYADESATTKIDMVTVDTANTYKDGSYIVPESGWIRICYHINGINSRAYFYDAVADVIKAYFEPKQEQIDASAQKLFTVLSETNIDGYLNSYGTVVSNAIYEITQPVYVNKGKSIVYNLYHATHELPIIAFYRNKDDTTAVDKVFVDTDGSYKSGVYLVPNDGYVRFCFLKSKKSQCYVYFYREIPDNIKVYFNENGQFQKLHNKNVCLLGDSIAYGTGATNRNTDSWASIFPAMTGCNLTNLAIGGSSLQYRAAAEQEAKSVYTVSTETDFSAYDICIIAAGTNDILGNAGTPESTGNDNACGALKLIIQNIMTSNPLIQVIYFTPIFRARGSAGDGKNSDDNAYNGIYLYNLADDLETVSKANHVPCKNMYRGFLCNKYNASSILSDGLHPNNTGHARLANVYADFVEANI